MNNLYDLALEVRRVQKLYFKKPSQERLVVVKSAELKLSEYMGERPADGDNVPLWHALKNMRTAQQVWVKNQNGHNTSQCRAFEAAVDDILLKNAPPEKKQQHAPQLGLFDSAKKA